jgi:predicted transcriptional regulator
MATVLEMATEIVAAHASTSPMTKEDLIKEIAEVHAALSALEKGETVATEPVAEGEGAPAVSMRKAFGKKQVICMICGKGMKTLSRHLKTAHDLSPKAYRSQFNIPRAQSLSAKDYSEARKQMALDRGLGANLVAARAAKIAKAAKPKAKPKANVGTAARAKAKTKKTEE